MFSNDDSLPIGEHEMVAGKLEADLETAAKVGMLKRASGPDRCEHPSVEQVSPGSGLKSYIRDSGSFLS
jgi:hypothetical protein